MAGVVHIPWYATVFRGDKLAEAIAEVSAFSLRYGATQYRVHRSLDDKYSITQMLWFDSKLDWERYWEGPEMNALRTRRRRRRPRRSKVAAARPGRSCAAGRR
jgi:hypothetical protein